MKDGPFILIACGLNREAAVIRKGLPDARIIAGGGDGARLEARLWDAAAEGASLILSMGIAGGLDPALAPGAVVVDGDPVLTDRLLALLGACPTVRVERTRDTMRQGLSTSGEPTVVTSGIIGRDAAVDSGSAKAELRRATGAAAVDMESHIAARVAAAHGVPFAAIRVVADGAHDALPPAALVGMKPDGGMALGTVLASLARHPTQLPALIRTGRQAALAMKRLSVVAAALRGWRS